VKVNIEVAGSDGMTRHNEACRSKVKRRACIPPETNHAPQLIAFSDGGACRKR
jgi:hypothetical protein